MQSPAELTDLFRSRGLKVTPQRQCIFGVLHGSDQHPTAEAVHAEVVARMPTVSLRTVYQTLNDLAAMGELTSVDVGTGSTRFDPTVEPHHHLVCDGCGRIQDLYASFGDVTVPAGTSVMRAAIEVGIMPCSAMAMSRRSRKSRCISVGLRPVRSR